MHLMQNVRKKNVCRNGVFKIGLRQNLTLQLNQFIFAAISWWAYSQWNWKIITRTDKLCLDYPICLVKHSKISTRSGIQLTLAWIIMLPVQQIKSNNNIKTTKTFDYMDWKHQAWILWPWFAALMYPTSLHWCFDTTNLLRHFSNIKKL